MDALDARLSLLEKAFTNTATAAAVKEVQLAHLLSLRQLRTEFAANPAGDPAASKMKDEEIAKLKAELEKKDYRIDILKASLEASEKQ